MPGLLSKARQGTEANMADGEHCGVIDLAFSIERSHVRFQGRQT
jgi:hypothetical protein